MQLITIYWRCNVMEKRAMIERFSIPVYTTINGETPFEVDEDLLDDLRRYERNGLIEIRPGNERLLKAYKTLK